MMSVLHLTKYFPKGMNQILRKEKYITYVDVFQNVGIDNRVDTVLITDAFRKKILRPRIYYPDYLQQGLL